MKNRSSERTCFKNQSSERVRLKNDQLQCIRIAVDRFFKWTLSLDRFLKLAFLSDRFFIEGIEITADPVKFIRYLDLSIENLIPRVYLSDCCKNHESEEEPVARGDSIQELRHKQEMELEALSVFSHLTRSNSTVDVTRFDRRTRHTPRRRSAMLAHFILPGIKRRLYTQELLHVKLFVLS